MVKLENLFSGIQENEEFLIKKIEQYEHDMQSSKEQYDKPFEYQQEYDEKIKRQAELNVLLDLENQKNEDIIQGKDIDECEDKDENKSDDKYHQNIAQCNKVAR